MAAYGGKLRYPLSYTAGPQGSPLLDPDIQITVSSLESTVVRQKSKWKPRSQYPASQCGLLATAWLATPKFLAWLLSMGTVGRRMSLGVWTDESPSGWESLGLVGTPALSTLPNLAGVSAGQ